MRIAIAYNFNDTDWFGGRNYFASLFRAVAALEVPDVQFVFVTGRNTRTTLPDEFPFLDVHRTPLMDRLHPLWLIRQTGLRAFDTDPLLERTLRRLGVDLLSHSGHLGKCSRIRTLPWLFDFQFMHLPEHWTPRQLRWVARRYIASCAQGDGVIVSSEDALRDLRAFLPNTGVPMHVLRFVSNPANLAQLPSVAALRERYDLPAEFFHVPNQFWTHKNHMVVINALGLLKQRNCSPLVVCTGNTSDVRSPNHFAQLVEHARALGVENSFKVLGVVPYTDTQALMAHAVAVINPSRFEGWSTTVEEAKTLGRPMLLSNLSVHREQSPEHGRFFDPDDPDELARLMEDTLSQRQPLASPDDIASSYRQRAALFAQRYLDIVRMTIG